ncbi:hypothetical protein D9O50_11705 [Oxalobacteraceae bacterium CAVE-383]|nr:hypothetical protein D9O50_11705 [Oxalobacteraceae bacterium CAVE-383]
MAVQAVWGHANLVERLRRTLPDGPFLVRSVEGHWINAHDWRALQDVLLPRIWNYGLAHKVSSQYPFFPIVLKGLVRIAAWKGRRAARPWVITPSRKLKNGLTQALNDAGASIAVLQPTAGGLKDYADVIRNLCAGSRIQNFPVAPFGDNDNRVQETLALLHQMGQSISNDRVRAAWELYQVYFARAVPSMLAIAHEGSALIRTLQPSATISYETNSWVSAALMEASGLASVKRMVFNHNSQPPSGSSIANTVLGTLFYQRTCNALIDIASLWSPASLQRLKGISDMRGKPFAKCVRLNYPVRKHVRQAHEPLRILHAGNYQNWSDFFPWIAETADEYLAGIETLAATVESLENVELTIRVRPKREVDAKTVEDRLKNRHNIRVCGADQNFIEQLAESDLLIAHFSTTIEQALQMGKPVLLWGSTDRYQQFPAQTLPPGEMLVDRVYVAQTAEALPAMLRAIRDARDIDTGTHEHSLRYGFDVNAEGLEDLAKDVINKSLSQLE